MAWQPSCSSTSQARDRPTRRPTGAAPPFYLIALCVAVRYSTPNAAVQRVPTIRFLTASLLDTPLVTKAHSVNTPLWSVNVGGYVGVYVFFRLPFRTLLAQRTRVRQPCLH